MAMDRPRINVAIHMRQPSGQGVIRRLSPAATRPVRPPATRCHRRSIYRSTTRPRMGELTVPSPVPVPVSFLYCHLSLFLMKYAIIKADTLSSSWYWSQYRLCYHPFHQQLITHSHRRMSGTWHSGCTTLVKVIETLKHLRAIKCGMKQR